MFDQEEGGSSVAGVLADNASLGNHLRVDCVDQVANELEVGTGRQPSGQLPRRFEVGEQDRRWAPGGVSDRKHPLERRTITAG